MRNGISCRASARGTPATTSTRSLTEPAPTRRRPDDGIEPRPEGPLGELRVGTRDDPALAPGRLANSALQLVGIRRVEADPSGLPVYRVQLHERRIQGLRQPRPECALARCAVADDVDARADGRVLIDLRVRDCHRISPLASLTGPPLASRTGGNDSEPVGGRALPSSLQTSIGRASRPASFHLHNNFVDNDTVVYSLGVRDHTNGGTP